MKKACTILILGFLIITLSSCENNNSPARGDEDEIYVVADSVEYETLKPALESVFEKVIYTPQPEKLFTLKRISPNYIESNEKKKNIIILAPQNSSSNTSKLIEAVIDSGTRQKLYNDKNYLVKKYNLWAKNQLVIFLTAPSLEDLRQKIARNKENLIFAFKEISDKRLYGSLYNEKNEQESVEGNLLKDYGWIIYVQPGYKLAVNSPAHKVVRLAYTSNNDMEKWIFIHWVNNASPDYLNEDSVRAIRNRMTAMFYPADTSDGKGLCTVAEGCYTADEVDYNGRYAICTQGLWEHKDKKMNGPFINYTFYDEKSRRLYMLDGAVYAPRFYKRNLIQQMDVILQSFMTSDELSKDKKEKLLSAAR